MNWWKDIPARIAMHFSNFLSLIRGITSLDRVLLREVQPMTWDHMQFSIAGDDGLVTKIGAAQATAEAAG